MFFEGLSTVKITVINDRLAPLFSSFSSWHHFLGLEPGTASLVWGYEVRGVQEMASTSLLELTALLLEAKFPHACSVLFVVIVSKTHVSVEHHHFVKPIRFGL